MPRGDLLRSPRDEKPRTPPGPEGSNGSGVSGAGVWLGQVATFCFACRAVFADPEARTRGTNLWPFSSAITVPVRMKL